MGIEIRTGSKFGRGLPVPADQRAPTGFGRPLGLILTWVRLETLRSTQRPTPRSGEPAETIGAGRGASFFFVGICCLTALPCAHPTCCRMRRQTPPTAYRRDISIFHPLALFSPAAAPLSLSLPLSLSFAFLVGHKAGQVDVPKIAGRIQVESVHQTFCLTCQSRSTVSI